MSMFEMTDDDVRKLYADASEHEQARILRDHMEAIVREGIRRALDGWGEHMSREELDYRARDVLEKLLRVCNEKGWERIGRPIMAKMEAEHQKQVAMNYLMTQEMLKPMTYFVASGDPKP